MFTSSSAETAFLVDRVRTLGADTPAGEIAVVAKTKSRVKAYADALDDAGIAHVVLEADADDIGPGVRVATMHRVKGLDFTHVVTHMPSGATPPKDPREQSVLYVAATRCRGDQGGAMVRRRHGRFTTSLKAAAHA